MGMSKKIAAIMHPLGWYVMIKKFSFKLRLNSVKSIFFFIVFLFSFQCKAVQECKSEVEVPATTPSTNFIDNGDGTITDRNSGLMWMKCTVGLSGDLCDSGAATFFNWGSALQISQTFGFAGYGGWRVPNIKELFSIVEGACKNPAINLNVFPETNIGFYWTSTPDAYDLGENAWSVHFYLGHTNSLTRIQNVYLRLVR